MNLNFYSKVAKAYLKYKLELKSPFLMIVLPTSRCNLKCAYCTHGVRNRDMPLNMLHKIMDEAKKLGVCMVSFSGGEPLLYPHIIEAACYAQKKGFFTNLNTNGMLITKENAVLLADAFDTIRISLDGIGIVHDKICRVKGSYKKVLNSISMLNKIGKKKAKIGINFVVSKENEKSARKVATALAGNVDFITFLPRFSFVQDPTEKYSPLPTEVKEIQQELMKNGKSGNTKEFLKKASLDYSKSICDAGRLYFTVFSDGKVTPCPFRHRLIAGDVKDKNLIEIYEEMSKTNVKDCAGCYATCTTEVSRVFRMSPLKLLKAIPKLRDVYKF